MWTNAGIVTTRHNQRIEVCKQSVAITTCVYVHTYMYIIELLHKGLIDSTPRASIEIVRSLTLPPTHMYTHYSMQRERERETAALY